MQRLIAKLGPRGMYLIIMIIMKNREYMLQAPFLELDDGSKLTQSSAICMYCAGEAGMLPSDPFELARTVELTNTLEDVCILFLRLLLRCVELCMSFYRTELWPAHILATPRFLLVNRL